MSRNRVVAVIPARFASTRFPGKLLAEFHGHPLLEWVYRRARQIEGVDRVIVATDDARIERVASEFGAEVRLTRPDHESGTDRIGEVLASLESPPEFVLNLQGDEPLLPVDAVERMLAERAGHPDAVLTLVEPIRDEEEWRRPSVVKAALARDGRVLYFSRAPIPYPRSGSAPSAIPSADPGPAPFWRHVGIYGYPSTVLSRMVSLEPSPLERIEGLEQLRWMEAGVSIVALPCDGGSPGIDVPEDLERLMDRFPTKEAWKAACGRCSARKDVLDKSPKGGA